jgi:nitrogen regulatory protein PII
VVGDEMKQIIAIVKPYVAERVLLALAERGHTNITIREVHGYGRQKSYLSEYERNEYSVAFLPKIEICVWSDDDQVDDATRIITTQARTGRMGDGKVFCLGVLGEFSGSTSSSRESSRQD